MKNPKAYGLPLILLFSSFALFSSGCKTDQSNQAGTYCCTIQKFCDACTTCDSTQISIGDKQDEDACKLIVEDWLDKGRYCHAVSIGQEGDVATPRFLEQCSN